MEQCKLELRTDIYYEYDAIFKVVRIFQVIERSKLMTDFVLVGYEPASSESQADQVVMQFRMANNAPVLPRIEVEGYEWKRSTDTNQQ